MIKNNNDDEEVVGSAWYNQAGCLRPSDMEAKACEAKGFVIPALFSRNQTKNLLSELSFPHL